MSFEQRAWTKYRRNAAALCTWLLLFLAAELCIFGILWCSLNKRVTKAIGQADANRSCLRKNGARQLGSHLTS